MSRDTVAAPLIVGIFVGGRGTRMGGVAKGLLQAPASETTLIERLRGELRSAAPAAEVVLVGDAEPYAALGVAAVADEPPGVGPIGGLIGLLAHAQRRGALNVLALACDLPKIDGALLSRLGSESADASVLLTRQDGVRNPLVARYAIMPALAAARATLQAGSRSLQAVLDRLGDDVQTLQLSAEEAAKLGDWDTPEDMQGTFRGPSSLPRP
jgi:molybdopterin-guanine dinucleotide biosynthesis protein A